MPTNSSLNNNKLKTYAAIASITLTLVLIIIKTIAVIYTESLALLSSMIDSAADLFASGVTFWAIKISSQPADAKHRYGHGKAESLSALLQAAFISGSGLFVIYDGFMRLISPVTVVKTKIGMMIMGFSLLLTIGLILFQRYVVRKTKSQAIKADAVHYLTDVITNIIIILSLLIVEQWNWLWIDTVVAFTIAAYLIASSYSLAKNAISLLMDKELNENIRDDIIKIAMSCNHINGVHDLRTHDLGGSYMFEMHIEIDGNLSLYDAHKYSDAVEEKIKKAYPQSQIIIHQDPFGLVEHKLDTDIKD